MTTREIFTTFGQHALAYWSDSDALHAAPHIEMVHDPVYDASGSWTGTPVFVAEMATEAGFSFDVDASGRWWIIFTNADGTINRNYSDDCGGTWTQLTS